MTDPGPALEIPTEVPWQLAATTQALGPDTQGPDTTTISLFTYVPSLPALETAYPDERLVYLKFTVSVSPSFLLDIFSSSPTPGDPLNLFSADILPIWRLLFDVRISPDPYVAGVIKPYFLAATPIRRSMIETGVVGQQASEGESKALAVGKSGSQLHEGYSSTIDTNTSSADYPLPAGGFGSSDTTTTVGGSRDVTQRVDTTQRDASTERQELVSHMTNVTNILSLLSASGIGSPYLRFSLWSRPLRPLVIDASDPSVWYAELLRRRSSGLEGIQEFYAVAVVPRGAKGFCVKTELRRFCVIPPPLPSPKDLTMPPGDPSPAVQAKLIQYLDRKFPRGTPTDDLDVEVTFTGNAQTFRPAVTEFFSMNIDSTHIEQVMRVQAVDWSPGGGPTNPAGFYKTHPEIWLDMKREEYEQAVVQSPLAGGLPIVLDLAMTTCFGPPTAQLTVANKTVKPSKPSFLTTNIAQAAANVSTGGRKLDAYRQAVLNWNAAEAHFGSLVTHTAQLPTAPLQFDHPRMADFALRRLAELAPDDPVNQSLQNAAGWFGLQPAQITSFQRLGIADVRGLAEAIVLAPVVESVNLRRAASSLPRGPTTPAPTGAAAAAAAVVPAIRPPALPVVLSAADAARLKQAFAAALQARAAGASR